MPIYKKGLIYYAVLNHPRDPTTGKVRKQWVRGGKTKREAQGC